MAKYQTIKLADGGEIKLTEKEFLFAEHYLSDSGRNATLAAKNAGYSVKTAHSQGQRLLKNVELQKYIQHKTAPLLDKLGITQEKVLREFASIGFAKLSDYMHEDYTIKNMDEIDPDKVGAMESVEVTTRSIPSGDSFIEEKKVKFKLHDKMKALERLYEVLNPVKGEQDEGKSNFFTQINNYYNSK